MCARLAHCPPPARRPTRSARAAATQVFNALLAFNFLSEALRSLTSEFKSAANTADGLLAMNCGLLTASLLQWSSAFRSKRYLSPRWRESISDFGPPLVIVGVSALSLLPAITALGTFTRLSMPGGFILAGGRPLLIPLMQLPMQFRLLAIVPAIFLATLFFLDQHITVRTVNSPTNKLKKGAAYHVDLCTLGLLTGLASVCGLPWMVRAVPATGTPATRICVAAVVPSVCVGVSFAVLGDGAVAQPCALDVHPQEEEGPRRPR